tara:strand:- start:31024 stop:31737 length:714 start_codon:yes stop_codon:yes gene_type:complete
MSPKHWLEFDSNSEEFGRRVRDSEVALHKAASRVFNVLKEDWITRMKEDHFTGYYPGTTRGRKLRNRHGSLRKSVGGRMTGNKLGTLRVLLRVGGGRAGYARTQEWGIPNQQPVTAQWMRIPLGPPGKALTPTGRLRSAAVPRLTGNRTAGGFPIYTTSGYGRTFIIESSGGNLLIVARKRWKPRDRYKGNVLLFVLKKKVKIPARLDAGKEVKRVADHHLAGLRAEFGKILLVGGR